MIKCFCSGPFMNDGRCLKKKWSSPGIMNAITFTRVEIHIIDMTWNLSGYEKILYWVCNIWYLSPLILLPNFFYFFLIVYQVRRKDFWLLSTVTKLLKEFIPKLSHDADGLIFQVTRMAFWTFCTTHPLQIVLF